MMKKLKYYFNIWLLLSKNSFTGYVNKKLGFAIFLVGKILRFTFFLMFLTFLVRGTNTLAGYTPTQTILFFLTFSLIDVTSQFLFREVYRFRTQIVSGDFDLVLVKPLNALFRSLLGGADVIDFVTIPPILIIIFIVGRSLGPTPIDVLVYILLLINGLVISAAFHIAVISFGIITLEVDHTILIYRDTMTLGRFPINIYKEPVRSVITYLIPVGIMITFPARALLGLLTPVSIVLSLVVGAVAFLLAVKFWNYALRFYTSASS